MKEHQLFHARLFANFHALFPGAVSPTFSGVGQFIARVLRIINQDIGAAREPNPCRCGTHARVLRAIERAEKELRR